MRRIALVTTALLATLLAGCPEPTRNIVTLAQYPEEEPSAALPSPSPGPVATLQLKIYTATRHLQYVRVLDWERATATLSNTDATIPTLTQTVNATVDAANQRSASLVLSPIKPANNYTLAINLDRRDQSGTWQTVASGSSAALTLSSGTNSLSVPLTPTANGQLQISVPQAVIPVFLIISDFFPSSGSVGMRITLTGSGFASTPAGDSVNFNGTPAVVPSGDTGGLMATVPSAATNGPIGVTANGKNSATGSFTVVPSGTVIGTYAAGTGPAGIAGDLTGNIWVANKTGNNVSKLSPKGTLLGTFSTGASPDAVVVDASNNIWVANYGANNVSKLDVNGNVLANYTVDAGPDALGVDGSGNIWVACNTANTMCKVAPGGTVSSYPVGTGPVSVAFDATGDAYVGVTNSTSLYELSPTGAQLRTGNEGAKVAGVGVDSAGYIWCVDSNAPNVKKLKASDLAQVYKINAASSLTMLTLDRNDNCWIIEPANNAVCEVSSTGSVVGTYTVGTSPSAIALAPSGAILVANSGSNNITLIAP